MCFSANTIIQGIICTFTLERFLCRVYTFHLVTVSRWHSKAEPTVVASKASAVSMLTALVVYLLTATMLSRLKNPGNYFHHLGVIFQSVRNLKPSYTARKYIAVTHERTPHA